MSLDQLPAYHISRRISIKKEKIMNIASISETFTVRTFLIPIGIAVVLFLLYIIAVCNEGMVTDQETGKHLPKKKPKVIELILVCLIELCMLVSMALVIVTNMNKLFLIPLCIVQIICRTGTTYIKHTILECADLWDRINRSSR